jgi:hypothetical protein
MQDKEKSKHTKKYELQEFPAYNTVFNSCGMQVAYSWQRPRNHSKGHMEMYTSSNSFCKPYILQRFLFTNINIQTLLLAYYYHLFLTNHRLTPLIFVTFHSCFSSHCHYIIHPTLQFRYSNKYFSHPNIQIHKLTFCYYSKSCNTWHRKI